METPILSYTQKYAACALFSLALNQSQHHQWRLTSTLPSLDEEPIGDGMTTGPSPTVSDRPHLWIHEHSGLLLPVFKFMEVDEKSWEGLKETAGSSSQVRHHVGAFLKLLSDESETSSEGDKELALLKSVDAMILSMGGTLPSTSDTGEKSDDESRCCDKSPHPTSEHNDKSAKEEVYNKWTSNTCEKPVDDAKLLSCQRKMSVLYELLSACLLGTASNKKKGSQSVKAYDSRHRVAFRLLTTWLDIRWEKLEAMETIVACSLLDSSTGKDQKRDYADDSDKWKQGGMIGAAAVAGGTVIGVTGGVAAPAIAQGLSTVASAVGAAGIATAATTLGSLGGSIAIGASFGAAGAGLCGSKMAKRMGSIEDFEFKAIGKNHKQGRLAVGIMVSGLVSKGYDFVRPWEGQKLNLERYALQWESKNLAALSTAVQDLITSNVTSELICQGAMQTSLGSVMTAFSPPAALVNASDIIDSKWAVALDRSDKAGELLAEILLEGHHGNRPVTLIGFSLGGRLIFKCLQRLALTGDHGGLVERVVLLGAPVSLERENWILARKVVSGRFVNAYATSDWTLGVAFRSSLVSKGLAGVQPADVPGIENVDVTHLIEGHRSYITMTEQILTRLELDAYNPVWKEVATKPNPEKTSKTSKSSKT